MPLHARTALRIRLLASSALAPLMISAALPARANPAGPSIIAGHVMIGPAGPNLDIKQLSQRAIINWQSFSIAGGETTRFNLPSSTAAVLNRVTGPQLSALLGNLYSNGQVYLLNPNGIVIGPNGRVKTGGFIASTLNIDNNQFMQGGAQTLQGTSSAGVVVLGTVKATSGDVLLVAAQVDNAGKLIAPNGQAILAAGSEVLYVPDSSGNIAIEAPAPAPANGAAAVTNNGLIKAAGVQLAAAGSAYALAVNNGGMISAGSVQHVGGHVMLSGGDGDVVSSGTISAAGGSVAMTGGRVALTGKAAINVAAPDGGGSVTIAASNAAAVTAGATINASATAKGNGGSISIKATNATQFAGSATATGGPQGGNGGSAEISGGTLSYTGSVNLTAPQGATGTLLFDPTNIDVVSGDAAAPSGVSGGVWGFADTSASEISVGAIESLLQSSNLELQATNSLTFDTPTGTGNFVTLASNTTNTLTLTAPTITINAPISLPNGKLVFNWPDADALAYTAAQSVTSAASATITAGTVQVAGNYSNVTLNGAVTTGSLLFTEPNFNANTITINNAANAISAVSLDPGGSNSATGVDIESSLAMTLSGNLQTVFNTTFVAGGDLTLASGFALSGGVSTVFASTGGVLNNLAGSSAYSTSNGTLRIYSSTNGTGASGTLFNDGGIASGAVTESGVSYPSNPDTTDSVVEYFVTTSALPVLTITANSFTRTYGQPDPVFTASYSGGGGNGANELTTLPSFRILQGSDVNAGTYTIQPYGAASTEDLLTYVNGTLVVNPAVLIITANPASMTYGGTVPTFSVGYSGFIGGDSSSLISGLTISSNAGSAPGAGSYTITPSGAVVATPPGGVEPNYSVQYQTATLTVNPAPLDVTAVAASANYGSAIPTFQLNFSGFVNAGDASSVPAQFQAVTSAVQGSSVGSYPITLANADPNSNYSVSYTGADFTINPVPLLITPNVTRLYGGSMPAVLPAADFTGLVNGDTPSSLTTQPNLSTSATVASGVGTYGITASGAADLNYVISYAPGTLTINPAPLLITPNNESLTYGTVNPSFSGATYSGLVNGDSSSVVSGLTISTNAVIQGGLGVTPHLASPVGTYQLTGSGAAAANYTISYAPGTLTITPASLEITPTGTSTYGVSPATGASVSYNAIGLVNGDTLASLTTQPTYSTPATSSSSVGLYTLLAQGAADPNYTIRYQPGVLSITPATLTLAPVPLSVTYGATGSPSDSYTVSGLVNGDTLNTVFGSTSAISINIPSVTGAPAGTYDEMYVQTPHLIDNNYVVNTPYEPLTVVPATLMLTPLPLSVTYGSSATPLDGYTASGLVNGDTLQTVFGSTAGISVNVGSVAGKPVGSYDQMQVQTPPSNDGNYIIDTPKQALAVVPAPLSIVANSYSISGTQSNPTFTGTFTGLVNGDTPANSGFGFAANFDAGVTSGDSVSYPINLTGSNPNYNVTFTVGHLTVAGANNEQTSNDSLNPTSNVTFVGGTVTTPASNGTVVGTISNTTSVQTLDSEMQGPAPITINLASLGIFGSLPGPEMENIVNMYAEFETANGNPTTVTEIEEMLLPPVTPPTPTQEAELALLLPFVYTDLDNILNEPQSSWTSDQAAFVQAVLDFINQQQQEAATEAEDEYAEWYQQEQAEEQAEVNSVTGTAQIYVEAGWSANPPIPPASILEEAQAGMYLTSDQAETFAGVEAAGADLANMVENPSNIATGTSQVSLQTLTVVKAVDSLSGGTVTRSVYNLSPKLAKSIWPYAVNRARLKGIVRVPSSKTAATTGEAAEDGDNLVSDANKATKAVQAAEVGVSAAAAGVGVSLELIGAAVQIGMGVADYAQIGTYNSSFNAAIAADQTPLTISGLKSMMDNNPSQAYTYLSLMASTSSQAVPPMLLGPSIPPSVYESQ